MILVEFLAVLHVRAHSFLSKDEFRWCSVKFRNASRAAYQKTLFSIRMVDCGQMLRTSFLATCLSVVKPGPGEGTEVNNEKLQVFWRWEKLLCSKVK